MADPVLLSREFHGLSNHHDVKVPGPAELFRLCDRKHPQGYNMGLAYPPDNPVFWIKYGYSVVWGEMYAQHVAHQELKRLQSPVRVPAVFYACELRVPGGYGPADVNFGYKSFIVMKYVPGKTAGEFLNACQESNDDSGRELVYTQIALAISELLRIPVPEGTPPSSIGGGRIRHPIFDMCAAPRDYLAAQELEDQFNEFLAKTKRKDRISRMALEPMVFCYSDIWLHNFILDEDGQTINVVDFSDASYLPSSFAKYVLSPGLSKIDRDISHLVVVPSTEGIDNTAALHAAHAPMVIGGSGFVSAGNRLFGQQVHREDRDYRELVDDQGNPVMIPRREREIPKAPEELPPLEFSNVPPPPKYLPGAL